MPNTTPKPNRSPQINDNLTNDKINLIQWNIRGTKSPDKITYEMFKKLPANSLVALENAFNNVWTNSLVPDKWREVLVTPIKKPNKPKNDPSKKIENRIRGNCFTLGKLYNILLGHCNLTHNYLITKRELLMWNFVATS
ncbi:hypothetical protein HELRODRAFT_177530 [Helobdella robusta]|uniref:Reverse transcriptase domain-containing protein n=1 Tax=Helobdella robusta TaxID=6412 RepID=T1FBU6_HELRO|nr:hypothetical protein HELRODRAFT_177530 [Helobdella robusta]ESN97884.1 hypothetical protein HELRODRAFT_177530 [Helobdella robusta]